MYAIFYQVIEILAIVLFIFVLAPLAIAAKSFAPWIPTDNRDIDRILKIINLKRGENFYELGCGDGRIVFAVNKKFGNRCVGIELAFPLFLICKLRLIFSNQKGITFKNTDLFKEDLSRADVVYVFGMPKVISSRLKIKLEKELKKGTRVICYGFPIQGWKPSSISQPTPRKHPIFQYKR